jgi:hypothetical protein
VGRVILHIGLHKTASTSLQTFGYRNRSLLLRRGIYIATRRMNREFGELLTKYGIQEEGLTAIKAYWHRTFAPILHMHPGCTLVISHERINGIRWRTSAKARMATLRECLEGHQVRVLIYARRQDEWCESMHNQLVKRGLLTETLPQFARRTMGSKAIDLDRLYRFWADGLGAEAMDLRLFEARRLKDGNILCDYAQALGLTTLAGARMPAEKNRRLATPLLELKRRLNGQPWMRYGNLLVGELLLAMQSLRPQSKERTLSPKLSLRIMKRYARGNRWLATQLFHRSRHSHLFAPARPFPAARSPALAQRSTARLLGDWWCGR